jgi:2'-5' RNA ligase
MNHFLGFFLDDNSRKSVIKNVEQVSKIFSAMSISVRWTEPSNYHIKLQNLSSRVGLIKKIYISRKVQDIFKQPIELSLGDVKVGNSRNLKGLVYLEIDNGGNELRELRYKLLQSLKIKDNAQFIPHIALGRINKDLSNQEYSNIIKDVHNISKNLKNTDVHFKMDSLDLVREEQGQYQILKKFDTSL